MGIFFLNIKLVGLEFFFYYKIIIIVWDFSIFLVIFENNFIFFWYVLVKEFGCELLWLVDVSYNIYYINCIVLVYVFRWRVGYY